MDMKLRTLFLSLSLLVVLGSCAQSGKEGGQGETLLSPKEAQTELKETPQMVILDVRTPREYNNGHLKDAKLVDFYQDDFKQQIAKLPQGQPYLVYCHSGGRSAKAAQMMREMGFEKVYDLKGGVAAWNQQKLPLVKQR